jgi:hypothetical protein
MSRKISTNHPLRKLFGVLTERSFSERLGWYDAGVVSYVSSLLVDFTQADHLYKIRTQTGRRLEEVGEMLLEADLLLNAGSFEREREVHRHIGDFTLFMAGLFPEYLRRIKSRKLIHHPDFLIDYMKVGKKSYHNVSEFDYGSYRDSVLIFRKLSENFELCIVAVGMVREGLEKLRSSRFDQAKRILLN